MSPTIIVYAPHVCLLTNKRSQIDPGCDFRSRTYSIILKKVINGKLILSRTLRSVCDNNRKRCRNTPSRVRLRTAIQNRHSPFILEVHTFNRSIGHWRRGKEQDPQIVILEMKFQNTPKRLVSSLKKKGYDVEVLEGSQVNDVQKEVAELGATGMLLELSQDLTPSQIKQIGEIFRDYL